MSRNLDNALAAQRRKEEMLRSGKFEGTLKAEELSKSRVKPLTLNVPGHTWDDLKSLEDTHAELTARWETTKRLLIEAYHALDVAVTKDADAYAHALRNGDKDPGKPAETHARKCIADLERQLDGLRDAIRIVVTDVNTLAIDKHAEWSGQVEREYNAAVDKLLGSFREWLASAPGVDLSEVKRLATLHDYVHNTQHGDRAHTYGELSSVVASAMGALNEVLDNRPATVLHKRERTAEEINASHDDWNASVLRAAGTHRPLPHSEPRPVIPRNARLADRTDTPINIGGRKSVNEAALLVAKLTGDTVSVDDGDSTEGTSDDGTAEVAAHDS